MFFKLSTQESHSKFSVTNNKDEDHWENPSNASTGPLKATRPKIWNADVDF